MIYNFLCIIVPLLSTQRKHPSKIDLYHDIVTAACRQRKTADAPNKLSSSKQAKLPDLCGSFKQTRPSNKYRQVYHQFHMCQCTAICSGSTASFQINHPSATPSQSHLQICDTADYMKKTMIAELCKAKFVVTTTDCWSAQQKSYLGVTCHGIDEKTLGRRSSALAFKTLGQSM